VIQYEEIIRQKQGSAVDNNLIIFKEYITGNVKDFYSNAIEIYMSNINEKREFPNVLNEFAENVRKKSNSIVVKENRIYNQINQFKLKYPFLSNTIKFPINPNTNSKKKTFK